MENELVELVMEDTRDRMAKVIEHARSEFATVRTGRASSAIIENLMVEYYGTDTALKQLANFSVPEPRLLVVSPFDKGAMASIEKAISNADLGLNPSNDGVVIRLTFPSLTEERRKSFVKIVHAKARTDEWRYGDATSRPPRTRGLEKDKSISSDDLEYYEKILDKMTQKKWPSWTRYSLTGARTT